MNLLASHQSRWLVLFILLLSIQSQLSAQLSARFMASPLSGCAPLVVQFKDSSTGNPSQWRWELGNGVTSVLRNPSTTYFNPGTYTVKLIVRTASGADSVVKTEYITVYPNPVPGFAASDSLGCFPLPVRFTDSSTTASGSITDWKWDFGDGTLASGANPSHTYKAAGNFSATLRVTNSYGCSKTVSRYQYIKISNGVKADFSHMALSKCKAPVTINFTNKSTGTGLKYTWNFGDGTTSTEMSPAHTYTGNGTYTVSLMAVSPQGCVDTIVKQNLISVGAIQSNMTLPATICAGQSFRIANASTPLPGSVLWSFGDGTTSDTVSPEHIYRNSGTYTIKLVNNFGGCTDSVSKSVTVRAKTKPDFSIGQTLSCKAPFTASFTNKTPGNNTYKWDFGDSTTSTDANPSHTYMATGNFTVTLIAFNENGCSDTLVKKDAIQIQKPVITFKGLPATGCNPVTAQPSATVVANEPIVGYLWNFGDGTTSTDIHPSHTYTKAGNYNVTLTVTTTSGCSYSETLTNAVRVGDKPKARFSAYPTDICAGNPVPFIDNSTGGVDQWYWNFGDKYTSTEKNPAHVFDGLGKFSVSLTVWSNTCPDSIRMEDMVNIRPPLALFAVHHSCSDKYQKTFSDSSIGATSWHWDFGDGTTSADRNPVHTYATAGTYKVVLTVSNGTCSNANWSLVKVVDEKAAFATNTNILCKGAAITFSTPDIHAGNIAGWQWSFGDGTTATTAATVSHIYTKTGTYKASLTIRDILGCVDTKTYDLTVYGPVANFTPSASGVCLDQSKITFADGSSSDGTNALAKWIWNYGDGHIDSTHTTGFEHTYTTAGEYNVTLSVVDEVGCSHSITKPKVVIIAQPKVAFLSPDSLSCTDKPIRFTNQSTGYSLTYQWQFGDGTTSATASPVHNYGHIGMYDVGLIATDKYGCKDSASRLHYINISLPKASFTVSDTLGTCPPLLVHFTNTSSNYVSARWDFGDGNTSILDTPSHYYTLPGIYYAKLVVTGPGGCTDSLSQKIEVRGPKGNFHYEPLKGCKPLSVTFTAKTTNRLSFIWDFSDGTTIATKDSIISHTYAEAGDYVPKMIVVDANGCSVPIVGKDTIKVIGIDAGFNTSQYTLCDSGLVKFTNTTVSNDLITGWQWNFGDGTSSKEAAPSHYYRTKGSYVTKLTVTTQTGCKDSAVAASPVNVYEAPVITLSGNMAACVPAMIPFRANVVRGDAGQLQWAWDFGNGQTATVKEPGPQVYSRAGDYAFSVSATDIHGCKTAIAQTVAVHPLPETDAGADALVCRGNTLQLNATGAATYTWKANQDLNCTNCSNPVALPADAAIYVVTGTNQYGCSKTDSIKVRVRQRFTLTANPGATICAGDVVHLWADGADQYTWYPTVGLDNPASAKPKAKPGTTTVYKVVASDNDHCFADTAQVLVKVNPLPKVEAGTDITMSAGGSVQLKTVYSNDVRTWRWTPGASLNCVNCPDPKAAPKQTTQYHVEVKNAGGCNSTDDVTVSVICNNGNLFIPNTFTPNGDGTNDRFYPRGTGIALIRSLRIFNRWGEVVFERINFSANDAAAGWDGTFKGQKLAPDVYIYACDVVCLNNEVLTYKGDITLLR